VSPLPYAERSIIGVFKIRALDFQSVISRVFIVRNPSLLHFIAEIFQGSVKITGSGVWNPPMVEKLMLPIISLCFRDTL
jgi:hypothetical protein